MTRWQTDRYPSLLVLTAGLTYVLILLGVYTAAVGAGLSCAGRWPLCDGAVFGLFPANFPSFVEWFHRLVAMIVGFLILGSAYATYRRDAPRSATVAMGLVLVLLPVQILLGAETVLAYEVLVLIAHFSTAIVIFSLLVAVAVAAVGPSAISVDRIRWIAVAMLVAVPVLVAVSPSFVRVHDVPYQIAYNGIGLGIYGGLLVIALWSGRLEAADVGQRRMQLLRAFALLAALLVGLQLLVGRVVSVLGLLAYARIEDALVFPGSIIVAVILAGIIGIGFLLPTHAAPEPLRSSR